MEYNISEAELPTMVVRYENRLILRSVITGQHLQDLGFAPIWDEAVVTPAMAARRQRIEAAHDAALEALVRLYPCEEPVARSAKAPQLQPQWQQQLQPQQLPMPRNLPQTKPVPLVFPLAVPPPPPRAPSPLAINDTELPPCKVHRNYCCNYCSFCTQNPRSHLLHQRQIHGIRLSIHCCHHCQYASRYFQKLKRHVKMVHMGNSPGRAKIRNKISARRAAKTKIVQLQVKETLPMENQAAALPSTAVNLQPSQLTQLQPQASVAQAQLAQTPNLPVVHAAPTTNMPPSVPPAGFKNPEAFFEAAYRNQLIQQQLQVQRFKSFVQLSNRMSKAKQPKTAPTISPPTQPTLAPQNMASSKSNSLNNTQPTPTKPLTTTSPTALNGLQSLTNLEQEKKRLYGCRKCSYVTHIKSRYNKHVKYHSMPMIQCDKCEFRTTYKWNLTRHLRSHHGNGLYKCSVCSFSAHMKQSLTSHELNHHSPPVGHVTRVHIKPHRRRRCRVGGSDLMCQQLSNKSALVAMDIQQHRQQHMTGNLCSTIGHDGLKLVIKRETGSSSYSSSQTSSSLLAKDANSWKVTQPNINAAGKISSSSTESFSSSYSASPCSSSASIVSVVEQLATNGFGAQDLKVSSNGVNNVNASIKQEAIATTESQTPQQVQNDSTMPLKTQQPPQPLIEPPQIPCPTPQTLQQLINQPSAKAIYTSSIDSDPDSEDSDNDSDSTVSANETVPHGLHIAYESSSPDRKSTFSDSEPSSEHASNQQSNPELSQPTSSLQQDSAAL